MKILALDASTLTGSAAVVDDGIVLAESSARLRATHSEQLLPLVDEVLSRAGLTLASIDRIAVGTGPGSFTGVRIGVATAKGLHLASGVELVGVSSLDALAACAWGVDGYVLAALDARRGEVYAALYHLSRGARRVVVSAFCSSPEEVGARVLAACTGDVVHLVGDLPEELLGRLIPGDVPRFSRAPSVVGAPAARFVAWEAQLDRGRVDDGSLEPEYVRGSDAKLPRQGAR